MHAFNDIHAVTKPSPFPAVAAAMASRDYHAVSRLAASTGIDVRLAKGGPIALADLDQALGKHGIARQERIALKSVLARLGLLKN